MGLGFKVSIIDEGASTLRGRRRHRRLGKKDDEKGGCSLHGNASSQGSSLQLQKVIDELIYTAHRL